MVIPPNSPHWDSHPRPVMNLSLRELTNPEGVGYDLRVEEIFELEGIGSLGITVRSTPGNSSLGSLQTDGEKFIKLKGGKYYLAKTVEDVSFSTDICGFIFPRSTLFRSGVILQTSVVPAGYVGPLTFGLAVWAGADFEIELGARFAHLVVLEVAAGATLYGGQWNGGRVSAETPERQK